MHAIRRLALLLLLLYLLAAPTQAATTPSLKIWSVNNLGRADLLPGDLVEVVIELRSEDAQAVTLSHSAPAGLQLVAADASAGALAIYDVYPPGGPPPGVLWTGEVSATQAINLVLTYLVLSDAQVGDRTLSVSGRAGEVPLSASTLLRVCCVPAPPAKRSDWRVYLAMLRR